MKSSYKEYKDIAKKLKNGSLTFKQFDSLSGTKEGWELHFKTLMSFAEMSEKECDKRLQQITVFKQLNNIKAIIEVLMDIREKNNLTGDFATLIDMNKSVIKQQVQFQNFFYFF